MHVISIHAPRVGSDRSDQLAAGPGRDFNPRSPCGERLSKLADPDSYGAISIHAPRVGSDRHLLRGPGGLDISIHAPRVGSDPLSSGPVASLNDFNPRSPCGERPAPLPLPRSPPGFQSTLPVWGATTAAWGSVPTASVFQSTLPVWGATALVAAQHRVVDLFQSTLPVWGATRHLGRGVAGRRISIHAPRVGSDKIWWASRTRRRHFNPRSPCGERRTESLYDAFGLDISIHAPRVGSDAIEIPPDKIQLIFQSTLPVWGATVCPGCNSAMQRISIHAPRVGSDAFNDRVASTGYISIHAPRVGSD